jgi:hypothetical protein
MRRGRSDEELETTGNWTWEVCVVTYQQLQGVTRLREGCWRDWRKSRSEREGIEKRSEANVRLGLTECEA